MRFVFIVIILFLTACGDGGSSDSSDPALPSPIEDNKNWNSSNWNELQWG